MTALLIIGVYLAGWIVAASTGMRVLADRMPECTDRWACSHLTSGGWGHWRGDGSIGQREVTVGVVAAIGWPILWAPAVAYLIANRRRTPRALENHIAELEREAGIR